mmetsp:Transcript_157702/g.290539  ORF Transcript_157702/g.290539 Transcript_157702/m.290539 type:complete len:247 (-) Transcript_157702:107-847(-)
MVKIQPAVMPVTPLARGMWRFGGCVPLGPKDMTETKSGQKSHTDTLGKSHARERENVTLPLPIYTWNNARATVPQVTCKSEDSISTASSADACDVPGRADAKRYESVDSTGRVWGMPSAFGGGQCLDCPNKAVPPSMLCETCQHKASQGQPMTTDDLRQLQDPLNALLQSFSGKKHEDIARRLDQLYFLLRAGKIAEPIQTKLLLFAKALSANDRTEATRQVTAISAEHWDQHKQWLTGLKRVLSR